jgi:hypothetical protein
VGIIVTFVHWTEPNPLLLRCIESKRTPRLLDWSSRINDISLLHEIDTKILYDDRYVML